MTATTTDPIAPTETAAPAPLAVPEIPTTETDYDRFGQNRKALIEQLRARKRDQIFGKLREQGTASVCFMGLAEDVARGCGA